MRDKAGLYLSPSARAPSKARGVCEKEGQTMSTTKTKTQNASARKRILSVTIRRMVDDSPDTSWLGEYSSKCTSEFSIDRAHAEDCPVNNKPVEAIEKLEHVIFHIQTERRIAGDDPQSTEWESLDESIDALIALQDELAECNCDERGDMERGQYRYFNPSFNYVTKTDDPADGLTSEDVRNYVRQDYERMERLNRGDWCFIGIRAEAQVQTGSDVVQKITSGGLYGIESDSGKEHFEETIHEELANLKTELLALGFSKRAIASAFKPENIKEKND